MDLVVSGRIATLNGSDGFGWVEALAVSRGRVVGAGHQADLESLAGPETVRWRLRAGLVVTPSLTDSHMHLVMAALAAGQPDLTGLDLAGVRAAISAAHRRLLEESDETGWLLGHGWSFDALGGRPSARLLDEVAPGRPVALWAHDHHSRWLSSAAIASAAIGQRADPPAGRIERDAQGRPTGILFEHAAGLVDKVIPVPTAASMEAALIGLRSRAGAAGRDLRPRPGRSDAGP